MEKDDKAPTFLDDNPCWGPNNQHRLEDLLSITDRSSSIAYDSPQYLVLNKPPDLRMDGQYAATVHKLLTYWYPSPSLSTESQTDESDDKTHGTRLLEAVSRLHQYNDVRDNFLRPCHQLDYATSGVLLVAKTQEAASHISRLFESRHEGVQKSYMAVVVGDVRKDLFGHALSNESNSRVPIWGEGNTTRDLRQQLQKLEEAYRRTRAAAGKQHCRLRDASKNNNKKKNAKSSFAGSTFQGFQPAHSLYAKWKSKLKAEAAMKTSSGDASSPPKKKPKRRKKNSAGALLTEDDWKKIWEPVNEVDGIAAAEVSEFEKLEWKKLHEQHYSLKQALIRATDIHNNILRDTIEKKQQEEAQKYIEEDAVNGGNELPVLFRLSENSEEVDNNSGNDENTFYVCCPLAQHPDQFNMVIPTNMANENPHLKIPLGSDDETSKNLLFRPSLTKCTILESGTLSIVRNNTETEITVTKVRLYPMTGRRHQLRVHMALSGFPILGDVAYGGDRFVRHKKDQGDNCEQETESGIYPRMCLHAHSLQLPTLIGESEPNWKVTTSDPFIFDSDGKLKMQ